MGFTVSTRISSPTFVTRISVRRSVSSARPPVAFLTARTLKTALSEAVASMCPLTFSIEIREMPSIE